MSEEVSVYAGCVAVGGRGILIIGPSGSGKSDLALRLIDRGADLVSDDYTMLGLNDGRLTARPPETIAGKIECRGVGIVEKPFTAIVPVAVVIDLGGVAERMPEAAARQWLGVDVPCVALNGLEPSAPIKVEAALVLHGLPSPCPA